MGNQKKDSKTSTKPIKYYHNHQPEENTIECGTLILEANKESKNTKKVEEKEVPSLVNSSTCSLEK